MARVIPNWVRAKSNARRASYRSGLEVTLGDEIKAAGHQLRYELTRVAYVVPETRHHYKPDFTLDNGIVLEGKGMFTAEDRAKHLFVREQYPEMEIRFIFSAANAKITKGSNTTLADWCRKYGFQFATKHIPPAWFKEKGPAIHPEVLIKEGPYGYLKRNPNAARDEALRRAKLSP